VRPIRQENKIDDGGDEMDHGAEAVVGFVGAHRDAFEFLEFAEEVFDQVAPFVNLQVDLEGRHALRTLGDHDLGSAFIQFSDDPVRVEGFVGNKAFELEVFDQRCDAHRVEALARQQDKPDQIAECVGECQDLRRPAALGLAYGLALSPPFAPWP